MSNLKKNIEGIDIPPDVLRVIEGAKTDGTIASVRDVIKRESMSLVERTNNTFKELCRTLDNEQKRLSHLEEKRKHLQEEMQLLKAEIEKEKESCRLDLEAANTNVEELELSDFGTSSRTGEDHEHMFFQRSSEPGSSYRKSDSGVSRIERKSVADVAEDIRKGLQDIAERHSQPNTPRSSRRS